MRQPVDVTLCVLKELEGKWMVDMMEYMRENPCQWLYKGRHSFSTGWEGCR